MTQPLLLARVHRITEEAPHILSIELRPAGATTQFPPSSPGSHISLHLPNGIARSYSLWRPDNDGRRYSIAVLNERASRGGSRFVHEHLRVGDEIFISPPRNLFPLRDEAAHTVLLAGGIGITPIYSMLQRLQHLGTDVVLYYCARSRKEAAFLERLERISNVNVRVNLFFDHENGGPPDLHAMLQREPSDAHYYCCGPGPMLTAFLDAAQALGRQHAYVERFAVAPQAEKPHQKTSYEVELLRTGVSFATDSSKSLLHALLERGVACDYACQEGVCGACETRVISGHVLHADSVLSSSEQSSMRKMMPCVSHASGGKLVLDL